MCVAVIPELIQFKCTPGSEFRDQFSAQYEPFLFWLCT